MQAILSEVKLQVPLHKEKERVKDAFIYLYYNFNLKNSYLIETKFILGK